MSNGKTRKWRVACAWLALALLVSAVPALAGNMHDPGMRLVDRPGRFEVLATGAESGEEHLLVSVDDGEAARVLTVQYDRGTTTFFRAVATVSVDALQVEGMSHGVPFRHELRRTEEGDWVSSWTLGYDTHLRGVFSGPGDSPFLEEDIGEYRAILAASSAAAPVAAIEQLVQRVGHPSHTPTAVALSIALLAVDARVHPMGPIGEYLRCLREGCEECSGCWDRPNGPCHGCPRDSAWAQLGAFGCYLVVEEVCWFRLISPIRIPGK